MTLPKMIRLSEAQNHRCAYCGVRFSRCGSARQRGATMTVDHIAPLSDGGTKSWENEVAACRLCNTGRGNLPAGSYYNLVRLYGRAAAARQARKLHEPWKRQRAMSSEAPRERRRVAAKPGMRRYLYIDHSAGPIAYKTWSAGKPIDVHEGDIIFETVAPNILAADDDFRAALGYAPSKANHIGCRIEFDPGPIA